MSAHRQGQADAAAAAPVRAPYVPAARAPSSYAKSPPPPPVASSYAAAPPPYVEPATAPSIATKRAPPPPPAPKPRPKPPIVPRITYVTALYDYAATAEGDLSFVTGDKIELIKRGESVEDWWTGKLDGVEGVFPGNYVQS